MFSDGTLGSAADGGADGGILLSGTDGSVPVFPVGFSAAFGREDGFSCFPCGLTAGLSAETLEAGFGMAGREG